MNIKKLIKKPAKKLKLKKLKLKKLRLKRKLLQKKLLLKVKKLLSNSRKDFIKWGGESLPIFFLARLEFQKRFARLEILSLAYPVK